MVFYLDKRFMKNILNKEQKSGILFLLASKTFERLAFYLIMAILIQYLMDSLKIGAGQAGIYYSVFFGVIGITMLFSGLIGDLRDRMKIVKTGFILLTAMYLIIAFLPGIHFVIIIALIVLGLGVGLISPNIIVFLGNIYNEKESEITGLPGFILFSMVINIGALFAPMLSNLLKDTFGYNSVFIFAFLSGLISFILFLKFKSQYTRLNLVSEQKNNSGTIEIRHLNTIILVSILAIGLLIRFALNQKDSTFSFALKDYIENGYDLYQTLSNVKKYISIIFLLVFAVIVYRIKKLNWGKVFNLILAGLIFSIIAFGFIAGFKSLSQLIDGKYIFIQSYIFLIIAETFISPVILYSVYRSSPMKYKGLLQGISYLIFTIQTSLLFLGLTLYEKNNSLAFIVFAVMLLVAAFLILILKKVTKQKLMRIERDNEIKETF